MKTVINIVLAVCAAALVYVCYGSIMGPINFDNTRDAREKEVIARLIDIRKAQVEYRNTHQGVYTASFDTLIDFVKTAKLPFVKKEGALTDEQLEKGMTEKKAMALINKAKKTAISYEEKLKKYLQSVLVSNELADRVRAAFDAYVFLSYRKKDRHHANELMRIIHNIPGCRDIAIWFDEFLSPGESFRSNIESAMTKSQLFTLLVTPNLLEDGNYVMLEEYPMAIKAKMSILAAEMEKTNIRDLQQRYIDLPNLLLPFGL